MSEAAGQARPVRESQVVMTQMMEPAHANASGNVHGGVIMHLVDNAAGVCAMRHCRTRVVTAWIDSMSFLFPVYVGNVLTVSASVNDVGNTSMEIGVRVESEDLRSGQRHHTSSAYLVMVALDDEGNPAPIPPVLVGTDSERRRQTAAKLRRAHRKVQQDAIKSSMDE